MTNSRNIPSKIDACITDKNINIPLRKCRICEIINTSSPQMKRVTGKFSMASPKEKVLFKKIMREFEE